MPPDRPARTDAFVQVYLSLATSGRLAEITGSALKVLHALALAASPLGAGGPDNAAFFDGLVARRALTPADRGRLFCCLSHHELVRQTGLSKNTITRCTAELARLAMIEKRVVRRRGFLRYNLFFLSHYMNRASDRPRR